ncbi:zinc ribbon domain-containing protein [candidate division KSB1 bacterium]|nr:zinc ribbon domain-containing protein [candidate division KSB1 bacterium]
MPIFEFKCNTCGTVSEMLVKGAYKQPVCSCGSNDMKKLISVFAVSEGQSSTQSSCSDGSCALSQPACASGMCGL